MRSGIEVVMDLMNFDQMLDGVDYVISGEGRADAQTLHGKVLYGIGRRCKEEISQLSQSVVVLVMAMKRYMNTVLQSSMPQQIRNYVKNKF